LALVKAMWLNNLVTQFLMLMLRLLNYIEKVENAIANLKKYFLII